MCIIPSSNYEITSCTYLLEWKLLKKCMPEVSEDSQAVDNSTDEILKVLYNIEDFNDFKRLRF